MKYLILLLLLSCAKEPCYDNSSDNKTVVKVVIIDPSIVGKCYKYQHDTTVTDYYKIINIGSQGYTKKYIDYVITVDNKVSIVYGNYTEDISEIYGTKIDCNKAIKELYNAGLKSIKN